MIIIIIFIISIIINIITIIKTITVNSIIFANSRYCLHQLHWYYHHYHYAQILILKTVCTHFRRREKHGTRTRDNCRSQRGDLVSIETEDERNFIKKSNDTIYHIGLEKKASNWTWVSGRQLNFPQWINNLSRSDGEVASISWKSNDECMQVKSGARDADYLYIFEFHKSNSKLQLSSKKVFKRKSIPKTLRRNKCILMDPAGFTDI